VKNAYLTRKIRFQKLIAFANRKPWWHVPPADGDAYEKRGKFLASSFAEAEFYGRPLDKPQKVSVSKPLVGDEKRIADALGVPAQREGMTYMQIAARDASWRKAALRKGYDAILLMAPMCFAEWKSIGKVPRSLELNVLAPIKE